ncbi:retropepsin-like protein [Gossypium australe]|uniref:Retropepsin-like protein n=1 Tax=Gossypium australe TaxID=47621 RepID=A0A5B6VBA6_9ROSI|nr:retropepsin-like protein [Gossypium australe]
MTLKGETILELALGTSHDHDTKQKVQKLDPTTTTDSTLQKPFLKARSMKKEARREKNPKDVPEVKQVPYYAKFLKELCTCKKKILGNERINVGENVFAVLQKKIPPMCKEKGKVSIKKAMCDLDESINVMLLSIYKLLKAGPLKEIGVII